MSGGSSGPTPHRRRVLAVFVGLLAAACTVAPEASEGRSVVAGSTAPALGMVEPEARERGSVAAVLTLGDSTCTLEMSDRPVNGRRIRLHVPEPAPKQTIVDVVRIGDRRSFDDPASSLRSARWVPRATRGGFEGWSSSYAERLPSYVDTSLQGRSDIGFAHGGMGPGRGTTALTLSTGWTGTWSGANGGAAAGTYAVICFRREETEWRVLGVAGPVEVPAER